jgi:glycosyltransferase involved in cell wall biosynthesis
MVCSNEDGVKLQELYGVNSERIIEVPNGVDLELVAYTSHEELRALKKELSLDRVSSVLFMGSWHGPNLDAEKGIFKIAERLPDCNFIVVGSVGSAFQGEEKPANVGFMGVVDEQTKQTILSIIDLAINPLMSGSGTNLKMLEYVA